MQPLFQWRSVQGNTTWMDLQTHPWNWSGVKSIISMPLTVPPTLTHFYYPPVPVEVTPVANTPMGSRTAKPPTELWPFRFLRMPPQPCIMFVKITVGWEERSPSAIKRTCLKSLCSNFVLKKTGWTSKQFFSIFHYGFLSKRWCCNNNSS